MSKEEAYIELQRYSGIRISGLQMALADAREQIKEKEEELQSVRQSMQEMCINGMRREERIRELEEACEGVYWSLHVSELHQRPKAKTAWGIGQSLVQIRRTQPSEHADKDRK